MSVTLPFNAGDSGCGAPGSTPTVTQTSGGLSGRIYANWTGDTANNGFSGSLSGAQQAILKSQSFQVALAIAQQIGAGVPGWVALTYDAANWGDFDATSFGTAAVSVGIDGRPTFRGLAKALAAKAASALVLTLPAGTRPGKTVIIDGQSNDGFFESRVNADGTWVLGPVVGLAINAWLNIASLSNRWIVEG